MRAFAVTVMKAAKGGLAMTTPLPLEQQYPSVAPLIIAIADWCRKWRSGPHASDLENCSRGDIDRIARDLGFSAHDLRQLEQTANEPLLLPRMLAALNINAAELARTHPAEFRDLQRVCALCDCRRRCKSELTAGDAAATYEAFCPNAFTLKALN